jgi:hypothetical protein
MKLTQMAPDLLSLSPDLTRSGSAKAFEERLRSSIEQVGLVEPMKVAEKPDGGYLVIDGALRLRAIQSIREKQPDRFATVPVYVLDWSQRFEIRFQSDIYQDLLPSQLAALVEHLHSSENVLKTDIARYIGISPATLRNYTGLWRLLQRGGLFAKIVSLMDVAIFPSSNPYAWLRLTADGIEKVLLECFTDGAEPHSWIERSALSSRQGQLVRFPIKYVETVTASLSAEFYRVAPEVRNIKRDLGLRRGTLSSSTKLESERAIANLIRVSIKSRDPVLQSAANSLKEYLR